LNFLAIAWSAHTGAISRVPWHRATGLSFMVVPAIAGMSAYVKIRLEYFLNQHKTIFMLFCFATIRFIINSSNKRRLRSMNTDKIYAESLANEYTPKDTAKVVALKKLDRRAKLPAFIFAYTFGIIAALITGVGMCLSMTVIGAGTTAMITFGIVIGVIGFTAMGINYPIYRKILENGKKKYAYEIVQLAKEISEN